MNLSFGEMDVKRAAQTSWASTGGIYSILYGFVLDWTVLQSAAKTEGRKY